MAASSSSAPTAAAAAAAAEATDGPVLSVVSKRLRALRKKYNRITQMEESLAAGKKLNPEQEEVLRSKTVVVAQIEELERLRAPLASALAEELSSRRRRRRFLLRLGFVRPGLPPARLLRLPLRRQAAGRLRRHDGRAHARAQLLHHL